MTKQEIMKLTLQQVSYRRYSTPDGIKANDDMVIAELNKRLPDGEIKTCEDFKYLNAKCCDTCHTLYPHYEMHLESLPDTSMAWICCSVRRKLLKLDSDPEFLRELAALNEFLGGDLSKLSDHGAPEASSDVPNDDPEKDDH